MDKLATTRYSKVFREALAIDWEYEQFEIDKFQDNGLLKHNIEFIKYHIYQKQFKDGIPFIHGLIRFYTPHKYGCVHLLIGKGDYCNIRKSSFPDFIKLECSLPDPTNKPVEFGQFKSSTKLDLPNPPTNSIKKDVNTQRPNVDVSFAEYLINQSTLSNEDKKLVPVLYKYYNS